MDHFEMVAIGSGPAGEKAAAQAAYFGHKVAVVDRASRPGGAPVNSGGIPTKTLRESALYLTGFRRRDIYGVGMQLGPELMLDRLHTRAAEVQEAIGREVQRNFDRHEVELIHGEATLADKAVEVKLPTGETRTLSADVILIATGSRPFRPPDIPFDDPDVHDSDSILALNKIPESMVVIGGGPVGVEYASVFFALGVKVTLLDMSARLVPFMDSEASQVFKDALEAEGLMFLLGQVGTVERVDETLTVTLENGKVLEPDVVLFAAGRVGNTEELGLDQAGIETDERGRIRVDGHFETSIPGIYAAGDVIGPPALASVSTEQGRVAACHAFDIPFKDLVDPLAPYGVYSIPELGMVGMTEDAAKASGIDYEVGRSWFADNPRSAIAGTQQGFIKLILDRNDRRLLGAHIVGEEAAELIHIAQEVLHSGGTIDRFIDSTYNVPTRSEAYKYAAYDALGRLATTD